MEHRKALLSDLPAIMEIVGQAQAFMRSQKLDQWTDGYPQDYVFAADIERGECWLLIEGEAVIAVMTLCRRPEDCYREVYDGKWLTDGENYAVIHRSAVSAQRRRSGTGAALVALAEKLSAEMGCLSLRVDTHRDNRPMRGLLEKCGFTYCGWVYLEGPENPRMTRVIYEKLLREA